MEGKRIVTMSRVHTCLQGYRIVLVSLLVILEIMLDSRLETYGAEVSWLRMSAIIVMSFKLTAVSRAD